MRRALIIAYPQRYATWEIYSEALIDRGGVLEACASPVLTIEEAMALDHNVERGTFTRPDGVVQADVAPRFSRTPGSISRTPPATGQHTVEVLLELGLTAEAIDQLHANNTVHST